MKAKDIMTGNVEAVSSNQTIQEVAEKMKELNVGDIPVKLDGSIVGMVTDRDIVVRAIAHGLDPKATHVVDAMTEGLVTCKENDDIQDVAQIMGKNQIRRLPVVDSDSHLLGVVSLGDLAVNVDPKLSGEVLARISS